MNMNPEIKAKWVAALRGGNFRQGRNRLRNVDNTCNTQNGRASAVLSKKFRQSVGLNLDAHDDLTIKNDCGSWSFPALADWIEDTL